MWIKPSLNRVNTCRGHSYGRGLNECHVLNSFVVHQCLALSCGSPVVLLCGSSIVSICVVTHLSFPLIHRGISRTLPIGARPLVRTSNYPPVALTMPKAPCRRCSSHPSTVANSRASARSPANVPPSSGPPVSTLSSSPPISTSGTSTQSLISISPSTSVASLTLEQFLEAIWNASPHSASPPSHQLIHNATPGGQFLMLHVSLRV